MHSNPHSFERRVVVSLASLYAFRMLGLFMVLPILVLYGDEYSGSTPALLGLALGAYGFSQAFLQIPFGVLSDRIGRKPIIAAGLLLFILGSVVAALAESIYGLIFGRFLQGCGAISSAVMALLTDLTSDKNRTKAMATIGASIGVSFAIAIIIGPALATWGGLATVFWLTAGLGVLGLYILFQVVPSVARHTDSRPKTAIPALLLSSLRNPELLRLNVGIFVLHFVLMASFVVLPGILENRLGVPRQQHWLIYLPLLAGSFVTMLPFIILAEKYRKIKPVFIGSVVLLVLAELWLGQAPSSLYSLLPGLFVFFMAFNLLEATLPSLMSKIAPVRAKGAAMGIYSTCQFFGAFCGGVAGGGLLQAYGVNLVFWVCAGLILVWIAAALSMRPPRYLASMMLSLNGLAANDVSGKLGSMQGVKDVVIVESENMVYLKVDQREVDHEQINALLQPSR